VDRLVIPLAAAIAVVIVAYRTAAARCRELGALLGSIAAGRGGDSDPAV
jgi:hypothetical protein